MRDGVVPVFTVAQNLLLVENRSRDYSRLGLSANSCDPPSLPGVDLRL